MFQVLTYLRRKYDSDTFSYTCNGKLYHVRYPSGAVFSNGLMDTFINSPGKNEYCFFPDDEVTELLAQYGYNRCLNGFKAIAE